MTLDVAAEWRRLLAEASLEDGRVYVGMHDGDGWTEELDAFARNHAAELLDELDRLRGVLDDTHEAMWDLRCITVQSVDAEARQPYLLEALDDADAAHNAYEALR